jgi:hypothetical protein
MAAMTSPVRRSSSTPSTAARPSGRGRLWAAGIVILAVVALVVVEHGSSTPKAAAVTPATFPSVSPRQAVAEWLNGNGPAEIRSLKRDYEGFTSDLTLDSLFAVQEDCTLLNQEGRSDPEFAPIPDAQAEADWTAALALFDKGGNDCLDSLTRADIDEGSTAVTELQQADDDLTQTIARITALTGVTVS